MSDSDYTPKVGDEIEAVVKGKVAEVSAGGTVYLAGDCLNSSIRPNHIVSVERVEPPVVTYGPGDKVRSKSAGVKFLLAKNGFLNLTTGTLYEGDFDVPFTSEGYDLIERADA